MIAAYLAERGYRTSVRAYEIIHACDDWYRARETAHHRRVNVNGCAYTVPRIGFARRLAGDDANLCELIEINGGGDSTAQFERVMTTASRVNTADSLSLQRLRARRQPTYGWKTPTPIRTARCAAGAFASPMWMHWAFSH